MKLGTVALAGFMVLSALGAIASTHLVTAQETQPAPVAPQQNDQRAAIARINPQKPIQIRVISQTDVPVVASTFQASARLVAPGKSVTFGRLHTSYLSLPINLQVSLKNNPDPTQDIRVYADVKTSGNEIIVGVKTAQTGSGNSVEAINVDQQGLIYLY
ncbi:hypothetical protein AVDCRST_MAG81-4391 [uncultured Synechococcales cyanobacterium]|uniref:Uncharacterized protein n=1 Tax=uncultured Synechococcales cyanobacterium TaxID=1936017 RepID=A0A6J4VYP0_9CYAN|nr:hypothetical protein AVDCRST_MAG81-4391 [uncultured Synechococcales cyanobacterium]